jgi:hypothetical protein
MGGESGRILDQERKMNRKLDERKGRRGEEGREEEGKGKKVRREGRRDGDVKELKFKCFALSGEPEYENLPLSFFS